MWKGKTYSITPVRIVLDTPELVAMYLVPNTPSKFPVAPTGEYLRLPRDEWILRDEVWCKQGALYLLTPGSAHTTIAFFNAEHTVDHWKINLEEPMRRTPIGFDYMDQMLDIIISADRSAWRWKDEDEVEEAQARGIFSAQQAHEIRARGERVIKSMQANEPPFDGGWEKWEPEPAWRTPIELPHGWDSV